MSQTCSCAVACGCDPLFQSGAPPVVPPVQVWWNTAQTAIAACPAGQTGVSVTVTVAANKYSSQKNQQDADTQAYNAAFDQATSALVCTTVTTYYNAQQVAICAGVVTPANPVNYPNSGDQVTVPARYYDPVADAFPFSSTVSQAVADNAALAAATSRLSCNPGGQSPAAGLSGLLWILPYNNGSTTNPIQDQTTVATMQGTSGVTYNVTLRFRGIVEPKDYISMVSAGQTVTAIPYSMGSANAVKPMLFTGPLNSKGEVTTPAESTVNEYALLIGSPSKVILLNQWTTWLTDDAGVQMVDFTVTIQITAGSTVTLTARTMDGQEFNNSTQLIITPDPTDPPINPAIVQPYNGQFLQMDVVSVSTTP